MSISAKKVELPNLAADIRRLIGQGRELPPVDSWNPERVGEIDIRIAKDGAWFYEGRLMDRVAMVQLFSSILRKDGDSYFLVTPAEKMKIVVEDAPFQVYLMDVEGEGRTQRVHFSTHVGDCFTLSEQHPLTVHHNQKGEPAPYVVVRRNLNALIKRTVYYELAELAVEDDSQTGSYGVWSEGKFFVLSDE